MRYGRFALALALLVTAVACTGGGDDTTTDDGDAIVTDELDFTADAAFGGVELESGFMPDPYTVDVLSGGTVDVDALDIGSDCRGYAATAPDFRLILSDSSAMIRIFFVADESGEDATLIINEPGAGWVCNDDYGGVNPMLEFAPADEGTYDIWVGSFSADDLIVGTLYITELAYEPSDVQ
jgi:hypothetical protein